MDKGGKTLKEWVKVLEFRDDKRAEMVMNLIRVKKMLEWKIVEGVYCATGVDLSYSIIQDGDTRELKEFAVVISQGDSVLDIESFETMLKAKQFVQQHEDGQST